jgi:hypothetical protein
MGLYTDLPGRDPAEEAPRLYLAAKDLVDRLRKEPSQPERAEWALEAVLPLSEEFPDHAGLREWREEAARALARAYGQAGIAGDPVGIPGLFEARSALARARVERSAPSWVAAQLAFKHVLHRRPGFAPALDGLRLLEAERASQLGELNTLEEAARVVREAERNERRAWAVERKLLALAGICRWPEKTSEGVCPSCLFAERVTVTVQGRTETRIEGCGYRRRVAHTLEKPGDTTTRRLSEGDRLMKKFSETQGTERAGIARDIEALFELYLSASDRFA